MQGLHCWIKFVPYLFIRRRSMSDLILYTNPMSRGRIARWALEEVGAR